jgi:hypothetical protein
MYKIIVAFSIEAQSIADEHGGISKLKNFKKDVKKGYDWDEKEFETKAEIDAYILGLQDGNGWSREVAYEWEKVIKSDSSNKKQTS